MDIHSSKIILIGAGKMGGALLGAWIKAGISPQSITVVEPNAAFGKESIKLFRSVSDAAGFAPDIIVIAVKPQSLNALMPEVAKAFGDKPFYLSIAAGKTLAFFEQHLGKAAIVRAMPNTPAVIGKGISVLVASNRVSAPQKEQATYLLKAAGDVVWIKDETLMDAVTAISGSGPAYAFLFMEALTEAGEAHGLPEDIAKKLAVETVHGAAELARKSGESLEELRKHVTSPGGTTEAALSVLMKNDEFARVIGEAVAAAVKRSKELA